jgi:hypothetical protein
MKRTLTGVIVLGLLSLSAGAEEAKGKAGKPAASAMEKDPLARILLANQLAEWGGNAKDPLAYLVAAKLQKSVMVKADPEAKDSDRSQYEYYLAKAKELAGEDAPLQAMIKKVESVRSRGTVNPVGLQRGALRMQESKGFKLAFKGSEEAAVLLMVDSKEGETLSGQALDLDLYVEDETGNRICTEEKAGVRQMCRWTPRETGKFNVKVVNRSSMEVPFLINFR